MKVHTCERCGYTTRFSTHFKKHLSCKSGCQAIRSDVPVEHILERYKTNPKKNTHECCGCGKWYSTKETLRIHKKMCIPNDIVKEQPDASSTSNMITTQQSSGFTEDFYQKLLEKYFDASHMRYDGGISDITTDRFHGEIKHWNNWKQVPGQLQSANIRVPRDELRVFMFGNGSLQTKQHALDVFNSLQYEVYQLLHIEEDVYIQDMNDKTIMIKLERET